jgi:hypothetical protein
MSSDERHSTLAESRQRAHHRRALPGASAHHRASPQPAYERGWIGLAANQVYIHPDLGGLGSRERILEVPSQIQGNRRLEIDHKPRFVGCAPGTRASVE